MNWKLPSDLVAFASLLLGLSLSGCVNPYTKFYVDSTGGFTNNVILSDAEPKIVRGTTINADGQGLMENGYGMVGYSSFNAARGSPSDAIEQGRNVHAEFVVFYSQYTNTVSGSMPWTTPTTQTTTTNVYGNTFGSGGFNTYTGTARSTTYGSQTTYIPYNINRFDFVATYWAKMRPGLLGIKLANMTDEQKHQIGSNRGVAVLAVIKGSVAYKADFLKGDIIQRVGNTDLFDATEAGSQIRQYQGQTVEIDYVRDGKPDKKTVQLGVAQ